MRKLLVVLFVLIALVSVIGTFAFRSEVSKVVNGVSAQEQRNTSTISAIHELNQLQDANLYVHLSKADFLQFLVPVINEKFSRITLSDKGDLNIYDIKFDLVDQGILLDIAFYVSIEEHDVMLAGNLKGVVTTYFENGRVKLLPAVSGGQLTAGQQWSWRSKLTAELLDVVVSQLSSQLNAVVFSKPIDLELNFDDIEFISDQDIADIDGLSVSDDVRKIDLTLERAAVRIDGDGLSLLAQFADGVEAENKDAPKAKAIPNSSNDFENNFGVLSDVFVTTYQSKFPPFAASSGALIDKGFIAKRMNTFFRDVGADIFGIKRRLPDVEQVFSAHPRLFKKEQVRCAEVKQNCEAKRKSCQKKNSCANTRSCAGASCARNCSKFDVFCKTKAEACRAAERTKAEGCRIAARAEAEACRINERVKAETCRAGQDLEVANCKINNEAKVAACKAELEILRTIEDFLDIGELDGTVKVSNIRTDISVTEIKFSSDLSRVDIVSDIALRAELDVNLTLNPEGLVGHIACLWKEEPSFRSSVKVADTGHLTTGGIKFSPLDGGWGLNGRVSGVGAPLMIEVEPSPWKSLTEDKGFALSCTVADFALGAAGIIDMIGLAELPLEAKALLTGRYKYSNIEFNFDFALGAMRITLGAETLTISPRVDARTVQFLVQ